MLLLLHVPVLVVELGVAELLDVTALTPLLESESVFAARKS